MTADLEGIAFKTCSVCDEITRAVVGFLSTYQYELITSSSARENLAKLGGFCSMHTWQYDVLAGARGTCVAMSVVLSRFAERIRETARDESTLAHGRLGKLSLVGEDCPACEVMRDAEQCLIAAASNVEHDDVSVFCLGHFARVIDELPNDAMVLRFAESQAHAVARVANDMQRFVVKFDSLRRDLLEPEERSADRRGLSMLAGSRGKNGIVG
ncbi:MAG TPA: hypothetical protein VMA98_01735 [Candidatus Acidoferrales bacterium]|nr:hypothetical protein [Candidatus Acidoferrales bacterium]